MNKFKLQQELLKYRNKILSLPFFSEINIDSNYDKTNEIILNLINIEKTNIEWLEIINNIISKRENEYKFKLVSGIRNNIKWYAVLLVDDKFDINNLAKDEESGIIFFAPDLYYEYYMDKQFILFDAYYRQSKDYFSEKRSLAKLLKRGIDSSLYQVELNELYKLLFNEYKNKEKRSNYVRSKQI